MRLNKRKRNKSFCKTDIKTTEIEAMVLQHSVSQLSPNHFQHQTNGIGRKIESPIRKVMLWNQSSGNPLSQTPTRFAGSRFSDAPNPSLLPKPPQHWMTTLSTIQSNNTTITSLQLCGTPSDSVVIQKQNNTFDHWIVNNTTSPPAAENTHIY